MPIKARFFDPQPPVKVVDDGGFVYILYVSTRNKKQKSTMRKQRHIWNMITTNLEKKNHRSILRM